jgi:hypothetical protein
VEIHFLTIVVENIHGHDESVRFEIKHSGRQVFRIFIASRPPPEGRQGESSAIPGRDDRTVDLLQA